MLAHKQEGTALYAALPAEMHRSAREVVPYPVDPGTRPAVFPEFETWNERRRKG